MSVSVDKSRHEHLSAHVADHVVILLRRVETYVVYVFSVYAQAGVLKNVVSVLLTHQHGRVLKQCFH